MVLLDMCTCLLLFSGPIPFALMQTLDVLNFTCSGVYAGLIFFLWLTRTIGYRNSCVNDCIEMVYYKFKKETLGVYIYIYLFYLK